MSPRPPSLVRLTREQYALHEAGRRRGQAEALEVAARNVRAAAAQWAAEQRGPRSGAFAASFAGVAGQLERRAAKLRALAERLLDQAELGPGPAARTRRK